MLHNASLPSDTPPVILIVDDEPHILTALSFLLSREGFTVEKATNGTEGLRAAKALRPSIAILDVMMPGLDGFEVARQIRSDPATQHTHIIFLTAKGAVDDKMKGYDRGGEYYLLKPFDNDELVRIVHEIAAYG